MCYEQAPVQGEKMQQLSDFHLKLQMLKHARVTAHTKMAGSAKDRDSQTKHSTVTRLLVSVILRQEAPTGDTRDKILTPQ
jgi:hypothetical protein